MFSRQQSDPSVVGYVDANYVRDLDDMRSTTCVMYSLSEEDLFVGNLWYSP